MSGCYEAAREYLAKGLHPIPCAPRSKRPLVEWRRYQTEPPLLDELDTWWHEWPDANVALVLGRGTFAVDLDGGRDAERLLIDAGVLLPGAPRSKTANGFHVFLSSDQPVSDRVGLLTTNGHKPQVDIRGVGIVVAPPSIHPDGPTYTWQIPLFLPFPPAPTRLLELIQAPSSVLKPHGSEDGWIRQGLLGAAEGQRDVTCTRLAGYFLGQGIDPGTVEVLLVESFARNSTPPFSRADVRKCVQSIARRERIQGQDDRAAEAHSLRETIRELVEILEQGATVSVVATPFPTLNLFLSGGFAPGELIYVGARPGVGKTAFALECARAAAQRGTAALIVSREMVVQSLTRRILAQSTHARAHALRTGQLADGEWYMIREAIPKLNLLPLWMTDEAVSMAEIADLATRQHHQNQLGILIVDYLQLVRAPRDVKERRLQVEAISQALKTLAIQLHIPVLCLSSLSRDPLRGNHRPTLASLRESGELEHDADVVILLHREAMKSETECIVAKNRDGRQGIVALRFRDETVSFDEITKRAEMGE